jgi:hypothetical protein
MFAEWRATVTALKPSDFKLSKARLMAVLEHLCAIAHEDIALSN